MLTKIPKNTDAKVVGILVQFGGNKDTSVIYSALVEGLRDCDFFVKEELFKEQIFQSENFDPLFAADSNLILKQPTLVNLSQILVVRANYRVKEEGGKKSFGIELLARWISLSPITILHEFYYVEIMNDAVATMQNKADIKGFLAAQIHVKLCYEIRKYITKVN